MSGELPVVLLLFADDRVGPGHLRNLVDERRRIVAALQAHDGVDLRLVVEPNVTLDLLFDLVDTHHDHIVGLHYAGHADGDALHLEDRAGRPVEAYRDGLGDTLGGLPALRWIFLNGCATRAHVDALQQGRAVPVIATDRAILDGVATEFAARFYSAFGRGASIGEAFDRAAAAGRTAAASPADARRMLGTADADGDEWPWRLHHRDDARIDWRLPTRPWWRTRKVAGLALAAALVGALIVALWPAPPDERPPPDRQPDAAPTPTAPIAPVEPAPVEPAPAEPAPTAPPIPSAPAPLRLLDVRVQADELSVRVPDAAPDSRLDAHLRVRCRGPDWLRVELVETPASNAARRRFAPRLDGMPAVLPDGGCACALAVSADDGRSGRADDVCREPAGRARFAFYHVDEAPDRQFVSLLSAVSETVGTETRRIDGRDVEPLVRPAASNRPLVRSRAYRLAAAGDLLQVIWLHVGAEQVESRVLIPFDDLWQTADGRVRPPLDGPSLSRTSPRAYAITHKFHEMMLLAALAGQSRGRATHVEAAYLGAARLARQELDRLLAAAADEALSSGDRAAVDRMRSAGQALDRALATRLDGLRESERADGGEP